MRRPWPRSLGGRLLVLLISALAAAQAVIVMVIHDEQRAIVEAMAHGQALNQAVTLARLIAHYPPSEADRITAAFGSRTTCAGLIASDAAAARPPPEGAERHLTELLQRMLHGDFAGTPRVTIERSKADERPCDGGVEPATSYGRAGSEPPVVRRGAYSAEIVVPLVDGRTLMFRAFVEPPPLWSWIAVLSFLSSSAAVAAVVVVAVRRQTRSLRELAATADRFGRGEAVMPLVVRGPIEIASAIRAFNTMQERLHRFVTERLRLLAAVSHDLRTPLTTLRLKAEFIDDETTRDDIVATIDELTAITEATLAFTRAEASREETRAVDLVDLVDEVVAEFHLAGRAVTSSADGPVPYACRPVALKRAVRNLVENAVRYGGGARVHVGLGAGGPVVVVDDDGPGLPADRLEAAFEPFVRLEPSRNSETGGLGLGLAIARGIVQSHGGSVHLSNRASGGLRAEIDLPRTGPAV